MAKPRRSWLDSIENLGNKIPDITMLFFIATLICIGFVDGAVQHRV